MKCVGAGSWGGSAAARSNLAGLMRSSAINLVSAPPGVGRRECQGQVAAHSARDSGHHCRQIFPVGEQDGGASRQSSAPGGIRSGRQTPKMDGFGVGDRPLAARRAFNGV